MNNANRIRLVSIEGRWGQMLYPSTQKSVSVADLLQKEQNALKVRRPNAVALLSAHRSMRNQYSSL